MTIGEMEKQDPQNIHIGQARVWQEDRFVGAYVEIEEGFLCLEPREVGEGYPYLIPPFAEPHIHGGWGISAQRGEFAELEDRLRPLGVLFAVPTLINAPLDEMEKTAADFEAYRRFRPDSIFPFLRVEGPFISLEKKGIQPDEFILPLTDKNIDRFLAIRAIRMFTFAPELEGADILVKKAVAAGKIPSIGHSGAAYGRFLEMMELGVRHITHYPNALSDLYPRELGLVGAGLLFGDCHLEVIGDLIHSSKEFLELLLQIKGPVFSLTGDLITPAYGGGNDFAGRPIIRKGRRLTDGEGTIAGGATTVPDQAKLLVEAGFRREDIIRTACLNALRFFGRAPAILADGVPATGVLLSEKMDISAVFSEGRLLGPSGKYGNGDEDSP
jgi:N-acetylglucosamine-6-phosphate deacetylase